MSVCLAWCILVDLRYNEVDNQEYPSQEILENCRGYALKVHMELNMVLCLQLRLITVINIVRNSNKVRVLTQWPGNGTGNGLHPEKPIDFLIFPLSLLRGPPSAYISSRNIHCMCGRVRVKGQEKQVPVNPHCIQEQLTHYHTKEHVKGINHF